ncbi:MAG: hypothetical protein ACOX0O_03735 [Candidatus Methanoculleus thermohydrogenotrophicum]
MRADSGRWRADGLKKWERGDSFRRSVPAGAGGVVGGVMAVIVKVLGG